MGPYNKYEEMKRTELENKLDGQRTNVSGSEDEQATSVTEGEIQEQDRTEEVQEENLTIQEEGQEEDFPEEEGADQETHFIEENEANLEEGGLRRLRSNRGLEKESKKRKRRMVSTAGKKGDSSDAEQSSEWDICPAWAPPPPEPPVKKDEEEDKKRWRKLGYGKKGTEVKVEFNLETTDINNRYEEGTSNLSYTYDGLLKFGGTMTGYLRSACIIDDFFRNGGMCMIDLLVFDEDAGGNYTFNGIISSTGWVYIDFSDTVQFPLDGVLVADGRGMCGLDHIKSIEINSARESVTLTYTPATDPISAFDPWD